MRYLRSIFVLAVLIMITAVGFSSSANVVGAQQSTAGGPGGCVSSFWGSGSATGGRTITFKVKFKEATENLDMYVGLSSSDPAAVPVPATIFVPAGELTATFQVVTSPVVTSHAVIVTASTGTGCSDTHSVLIKAPILRSVAVQSVMRAGGLGKITVCLTGRAAAAIPVHVSSSAPAALADTTIIVPAGSGCATYKSPVGSVTEATPVTLTVSDGVVQLTATTVVKVFAPSV